MAKLLVINMTSWKIALYQLNNKDDESMDKIRDELTLIKEISANVDEYDITSITHVIATELRGDLK